jgi:modulator of FtsH protease
MQPNQNVSTIEFAQVEGAVRTNRVLRNTYMLTAIALVPMALGALFGAQLSFGWLRASPIMGALGMLVVLYGLMFAIEKNRNSSMGVVLLLVFTAVLGVMTGPLLQSILSFRNGGALIAYAVGGTAAVFFGMAALSSSIKRPLNGLGKFLMVGGIILMVSVVANIFLQMPLFSLVISGLFIAFSSLMILWQLNSIVTGGEDNYISATLTLVLSIYNIFVSLLQILGVFGGSRE